MDRISTAQAATMPVEFKLNGKAVVGRSDETLIETAKHYGIEIPHLCYKEGMRPDGTCREEQVNDVIGYAHRGEHSKIVFDFDDPMGDSTCVACGECVQACPTGALMPAREVGKIQADRTVDSVCPYCGVGCLLTYNVKGNKILWVQGRAGPANSNRLCVKGRYGFDYVQHKHRLTKPLIRKPGMKKHKDFVVDPDHWSQVFREASWEEALDFAAKGLRDIRDRDGRKALAGFGAAKGTNEEAYLFQKLLRTGFGSNNVDECTRLVYASPVVGLMHGL